MLKGDFRMYSVSKVKVDKKTYISACTILYKPFEGERGHKVVIGFGSDDLVLVTIYPDDKDILDT